MRAVFLDARRMNGPQHRGRRNGVVGVAVDVDVGFGVDGIGAPRTGQLVEQRLARLRFLEVLVVVRLALVNHEPEDTVLLLLVLAVALRVQAASTREDHGVGVGRLDTAVVVLHLAPQLPANGAGVVAAVARLFLLTGGTAPPRCLRQRYRMEVLPGLSSRTASSLRGVARLACEGSSTGVSGAARFSTDDSRACDAERPDVLGLREVHSRRSRHPLIRSFSEQVSSDSSGAKPASAQAFGSFAGIGAGAGGIGCANSAAARNGAATSTGASYIGASWLSNMGAQLGYVTCVSSSTTALPMPEVSADGGAAGGGWSCGLQSLRPAAPWALTTGVEGANESALRGAAPESALRHIDHIVRHTR